MPKYANPIIDRLDPSKSISYKLYRENCTLSGNTFVKDLSVLGRDLKNTIIIDNCPESYSFHPYNALPSVTWINDERDNQLYDLWKVLKVLVNVKDVRTSIRKIVRNNNIDYNALKELEEPQKVHSQVESNEHKTNRYTETLERLSALRKEIESKFNTPGESSNKTYDSSEIKDEYTRSELKNSVEKEVNNSGKKPLNSITPSHVRRRTANFVVVRPSTALGNTEIRKDIYKPFIQDSTSNGVDDKNEENEENARNEYLALIRNGNKARIEHLTPYYLDKDSSWLNHSRRRLYEELEDKNEGKKYTDEVEYRKRVREIIDRRYKDLSATKVSGLFSIEKKRDVEGAYKTTYQDKESINHLINATRERRHLFFNENRPIKLLNNETNELYDAVSVYERKYYSGSRKKDMVEDSKDSGFPYSASVTQRRWMS